MSRQTMYFICGLVCGSGLTEGLIQHSYAYFLWGVLAFVIGIISFDWKADRTRHIRGGVADGDNPRCFCPDCGADLGDFYSNRIRMERRP